MYKQILYFYNLVVFWKSFLLLLLYSDIKIKVWIVYFYILSKRGVIKVHRITNEIRGQ